MCFMVLLVGYDSDCLHTTGFGGHCKRTALKISRAWNSVHAIGIVGLQSIALIDCQTG